MMILRIILIFCMAFMPIGAWSIPKEADRAILEGSNRQLLENPGFESRLGGWNKTGSGTLTIDEATPWNTGGKSAVWTPSATGEFFRSVLIPVPEGLKNRPCSLDFDYKWAGSAGQILVNVDDGTANIASVSMSPSSGSDWNPSPLIGFTCPGSGSIRVEFESTAAAVAFNVDAFEFGKLKSREISQANFVGSGDFGFNGSCVNWTVTSLTYAAFAADVDCLGPSIDLNPGPGVIQTTDTNLPQFTVNDLPPGSYEIMFNVPVSQSSGSNAVALAINDGITTSITGPGNSGLTTQAIVVIGYFTYTTTGNRTFSLFGSTSAGSVTVVSDILQRKISFSIKKYPNSPASSITLETIGEHWDVNIGGANVALGNSVISSYTVATNSGLDLVTNTGSKAAKILCSSNPATGSTCSVGLEVTGIEFDISTAGRYRACFEFGHTFITTSGGQRLAFQVVEVNSNSTSILSEGNSRVSARHSAASGGELGGNTINTCGTFTFSSVGLKRVALAYEQPGFASGTNDLELNRDISNGQQDMHITIEKLDQQMPTPVFTDLTNSLNRKVDGNVDNLRTVTASINNPSGTFTITQQDGTWIDSITDVGVGQSTLNISAGIFSGAPNCTCTTLSVNRYCAFTAAHTNVGAFVRTIGDAGNFQESSYYITCTGPK